MAHEKNTPILFTSSIKAGDKTAYGKSKLSAKWRYNAMLRGI